MKSFNDSILPYFDEDNLIGSRENPNRMSSGNPLVLMALYAIICVRIGEVVRPRAFLGVRSLMSKGWMPQKKINCYDTVTHDDVIGMCAFLAITDQKERLDWFIRKAEQNAWKLAQHSYTFTSIAKPWHRYYYKNSAGYPVYLFEYVSFILYMLCGVMFDSDKNESGHQLRIIMCETMPLSKTVRKLYVWWKNRMKKKYGSIEMILEKYHGKAHPFSQYWNVK